MKNHPKNHSLIRTAPEKHLLATTTCKKDYVLIVREIHIQKRSHELILPKDSHTMLLFLEYHLVFSLRACMSKGYRHQSSKVHLRLFTSYLLVKNPRGLGFGLFFCFAFLFNVLKIEKPNAI